MTGACPPILIRDVTLSRSGHTDRLSANVDGLDIWFEFDSTIGAPLRIEPFLPTAILLGMSEHRDIITDGSAPTSAALLESLGTLQRIIRQWNPETRLASIAVPLSPPAQHKGIVLSPYSGGVDSAATLERRHSEITHLMFLSDFDRHSTEQWDDVRNEWSSRIRMLGKEPLMIKTNVISATISRGISSHYSHGSILCSLIAFLAPQKGFIPSSHTYRDLNPWGSHPSLDVLWSNETTQIVHDSADLTRSEKTEIITRNPILFSQLQVCWNGHTQNCGQCSKCIRTMLTLDILNLGQGPFPKVDVRSQLHRLQPTNFSSASFCWDLMHQARRHHRDDIAFQIEKMLRRYKLKRDFHSLVRNIIGKRNITKLNTMRGKSWIRMKLPLTNPQDYD